MKNYYLFRKNLENKLIFSAFIINKYYYYLQNIES